MYKGFEADEGCSRPLTRHSLIPHSGNFPMSVDVLLFRLAIITINANHQSDGTDCQSVHYGLRVRSLRNYDGLKKAFLL